MVTNMEKMEMNVDELLARIDEIIFERGKSKTDVLREAGITFTTLTHWKNRERNPTDKSIKKLADALGVPLRYLKYGDGSYEIDTPESAKTKKEAPPSKTDSGDLRLVVMEKVLRLTPENAELAAQYLELLLKNQDTY